MNLQAFSDWVDWLSDCWRGIDPTGRFERSSAGSLTVVVHRGGYACGEDAPAEANAPKIVSLGELEAILAGVDRNAQIVVRLPPDRYLKRRLSSKRLPFGRAYAMASIEIAESLPFLMEASHVLFPESKAGAGMSYAVVRKAILDPVISAINEEGLTVSAISFGTAEAHKFASRASLYSVCAIPKGVSLRKRLLCSLIGVTVILSAATFAHVYVRNTMAKSQLMELVEIRQSEAIAVRKKLERRKRELELSRAARVSKAESTPVALIWEELTRVLPDSTWLTDLSIRDGQISISGFSNSAANLITILPTSPLLADPSFASQVVRIPGQQGERFSIQMRMAEQ